MIKRILLIVLCVFSIISTKAYSDWTQQWWDTKFKNEILPQQQQEINNQEIEKCDQKIQLYNDKIKEYPNSVYYNWKLKKWNLLCK